GAAGGGFGDQVEAGVSGGVGRGAGDRAAGVGGGQAGQGGVVGVHRGWSPFGQRAGGGPPGRGDAGLVLAAPARWAGPCGPLVRCEAWGGRSGGAGGGAPPCRAGPGEEHGGGGGENRGGDEGDLPAGHAAGGQRVDVGVQWRVLVPARRVVVDGGL